MAAVTANDAAESATATTATAAATTNAISTPAKGLKKTKSSSSLPGNLNAEKARPPSFDPSPLHIQKVHPARSYEERTQEELICEIELVKGKLRVAHASVSNSKAALALQKHRTRNAVSAWRHRVDECRARMRSERAAHDQQMSAIVTSLMAFEEQLKQEQKEIVKTLEEKDSQIVAQQRRIEALTTANERLMKAIGRKQRGASADQWSVSEDESHLTSRSIANPGSCSSSALAESMTTVTAATVVGNFASHLTSPGSSSYADNCASQDFTAVPDNNLSPSSPPLSPGHALYATVPRAARSTTPKQPHQQQYLKVPTPQQQHQSRSRTSCDTLKEISNMKLPGSGGVYGRAGALRLILSSTTSESEDSKASAKKSGAAKKSNSNKTLSSSMKNINQIGNNASPSSSSSIKEDDGGGKNGGGGGARLVRRASASFRNWLSGSDRSDDDDTRESGWYSDYDLTSYRRHAIHPSNAGTRAANNAAIAAGIAAASSGGPKAYANGGAVNMGGRGSTLSRTFKSLLSPNPKTSTISGRRSKSPRVPAACAAAAASATAGGGIASSSSEDLAF